MANLLPGVCVVFHLLIVVASNEASKEFGCYFETENFDLALNFPAKAYFGELDSDQVMIFHNKESFDKFLAQITSIYTGFIKTGLMYDSLTKYLKFYKRYSLEHKCRGTPNFTTFYENLVFQIDPADEPGGNIMTLMKTLAQKEPKLTQSSYFVTRSQVLFQDQIKKIDPKSENLPEYFEHDQVAAVIKFAFDGTLTREGYIILDPEIRASKPVVVMDDGSRESAKESEMRFEILYSEEGEPITGSHYITASLDGSDMSYLYYHRKPYCSIVETTMKPSLLKFWHSQEKRDAHGEITAQVMARDGMVRMEPGSPHIENKIYDVEYKLYNRRNFETYKLGDLELSKGKLKDLCKRLNINGGSSGCIQHWKETNADLDKIFSDNEFLTKCQTTLKQLSDAQKENGE